MATPYLTIEQLATTIGRVHLLAVARDPDDPSAWDDVAVQRAIDDVAERIDAALRTSYNLPLPDVPGFLTRAAARLVHAELAGDAATSSELIESRGKAAEKVVRQLAIGELRIGGNLDEDDAVNARTRQGRAILVQPSDRKFRRGDTAGVV